MLFQFCIHTALSSAMAVVATTSSPNTGSGDGSLSKENNNNDIDSSMATIHGSLHAPKKILGGYESSIDVANEGMRQSHNPFSKEMDAIRTPSKTLRNTVSDATDKPVSNDAEEFNASEELGILHGTSFRNDTLIHRELQSGCGGFYPVVQAGTDMYSLVQSCRYGIGCNIILYRGLNDAQVGCCPLDLLYTQIGCWNTSLIDNMSSAFYNLYAFNDDISQWDVSSVTSMSQMFKNAIYFDSPIGDWNTQNVKNMGSMFYGSSFNQPIGKWNTERVTYMADMFALSLFNRPLTKWDTGSVTDMSTMFFYSQVFNRPIDNWDVSNVQYMFGMFFGARQFNQCLSTWPEKVPQTVDTSTMFVYSDCYATDAVPGDGPWCCRDPCSNIPGGFSSTLSCDEVAGLSSELVDELCNIPSWGIAEYCPELCLNTALCPCTDFILPFGDTSCDAVAGLKKKKRKKKCKNNNNVAANCPGTCTC